MAEPETLIPLALARREHARLRAILKAESRGERRATLRLLKSLGWDEDKHPRDHGKFSSGGGAGADAAPVSETPAPTPTPPPSVDHISAAVADAVAGLDPHQASHVTLMAVRAATKAHAALTRLTPAMFRALDALGLVFDTPDDLRKFGWSPGTSGTAAGEAMAAGDPVKAATGVPSHIAAAVAARVLGAGLVWARQQLGLPPMVKKSEEMPDFEGLAGVLAEAFGAVAAELGIDPPDAATVAAALGMPPVMKGVGPSRFGCAMVPVTGPGADALRAMAARVSDADLADDGREDDPHVTVRYGLHTDDAREVAAMLAGEPPVSMRLGEVSIFPGADNGKDYDVLKVTVEGDDLPRLHAKLGTLPHTDTHPDYQPHATIAYVKAGLGEKYAAEFGRVDADAVADRVTYSTADKLKTTIPLRGGAVAKAMPADDGDEYAPLYEAALEAVLAAREAGDDDAVAGIVDAYREHLDHGGVLHKAWDTNKHPRNDHGQFVSRDAIADAKGDPAKEEALREKVTDPDERAKLDNALAGTTDLGRTKRGQAKHEAGQRRAKRAADHARAAEIADRIGSGEASHEEMHELGDHLEGLTVDKLRALQSRIPTEGRTPRKADMVRALRESLERSAHMKRVGDAAGKVEGRRLAGDIDMGTGMRGRGTAAPREEIGQGNTGKVYRQGDEVVKNAHHPDGRETREGEFYDTLRGVTGVAPGRREGDEIRLPHYQEVLSVDTVKDEDARKRMGSVVGSQKARLLNAANAMGDAGIDYNDPLQVGFDDDFNAHVIDLSNAGKVDRTTALRANIDRTARFLDDFGAEQTANDIRRTFSVYSTAKMFAGNSAGRIAERVDNLAARGFGKAVEHIQSIGPKELAGYDVQHVYYSNNPRPVERPGILQSEPDADGLKVILSDKPLDADTIRQYDLTPVVHPAEREAAPATTPAATLDHPRLALAGFLPNRHDATTATGEVVPAGKGYVRYEGGGPAVGYTAAEAARQAAGVTPDHADRRIAEHERAAASPDLDDVQREYHGEMAGQLRGHREGVFGGGKIGLGDSSPVPVQSPSVQVAPVANQSNGDRTGGSTPPTRGSTRQPHEMTRAEFEGAAIDGKASAEQLDAIRAGDSRSKNAGDLRRVNREEPHVLAHIPLSSVSSEMVEHLRSSTDPKRVAAYVGQKIDTPIHASPKRKGGGFQVNDGGHRFVAALDRGDETIPALVPASSHRAHVESALAAGKPVPPEVLADYPDLAAKQTPPTSPPPVASLSDDALRAEQAALPRRSRTPAQGERDREIARELARRNPLPPGGGTPFLPGGGKGPGHSDGENEATAAARAKSDPTPDFSTLAMHPGEGETRDEARQRRAGQTPHAAAHARLSGAPVTELAALRGDYGHLSDEAFARGVERLADAGKVAINKDESEAKLEAIGAPKLSNGQRYRAVTPRGTLTPADLEAAFGGGAAPAKPAESGLTPERVASRVENDVSLTPEAADRHLSGLDAAGRSAVLAGFGLPADATGAELHAAVEGGASFDPGRRAGATVGAARRVEAARGGNNSGNSPKIPSTGVDRRQGGGDTTPVPATPAGGNGGKPMTPETQGYTRNKFPATYQGQKIPAGAGWTKRQGIGWVTYPDDAIAGVMAHDARRERYAAAADAEGLVGTTAGHDNARGDFARVLHAGSVPADESRLKMQAKTLVDTGLRGGLMPSFVADEMIAAGYPPAAVAPVVRRRAELFAAGQGMEDEHTPARQSRLAADAQAWLDRNGGAA